jgi:peptide-methionine (S)-S-oxide reductase
VISYEKLLAVFEAHDPTTLNRQGADVGTQISLFDLPHSEAQAAAARAALDAENRSGHFARPLVTEVTPAARSIRPRSTIRILSQQTAARRIAAP